MQWELDNPGTELITWKQLSKFLDTRSRALETSGTKMVSITNQSQALRETRAQVYTASTVCSQNCTEEHKLHACPQFKQMSIPDRYNCVKTNRACFNCLQDILHFYTEPSKGIRIKRKMQQDYSVIFQTQLQRILQNLNRQQIKLHRDIAMPVYQSTMCCYLLLWNQSKTLLARL